jgi:hypothetical protein
MPAGPLEETCSVPEYDANAERDPAGQQIVTVIGDLRLRYGLHFAPAWKPGQPGGLHPTFHGTER